jgi:hypothetical protein
MYRKEGNVVVKQDWVAVRIAGQEEAGLWRAKAFEEMGEKEVKEMICEMEGSRLPRSRPEEVDL